MHKKNCSEKKLLSVPDLSKKVTVDGKSLQCIFGDTVTGQIGLTKSEFIEASAWVIFQDKLQRVFSQYSTSILTLCENSPAIIHENGRFVVVDSHSRCYIGLKVESGKSVILPFASFEDLYHYFCCLANTLPGLKDFELCGFDIFEVPPKNPSPSGSDVLECVVLHVPDDSVVVSQEPVGNSD